MNATLVARLARSYRASSSHRSVFSAPTRQFTCLQVNRTASQRISATRVAGDIRSFSWGMGSSSSSAPAAPQNNPVPLESLSAPPPPPSPLSPPPTPEPARDVAGVAEEQSTVSSNTDIVSTLQPDLSTAPDISVLDSFSDVLSTASTVPPPLQYGDMAAMGLTHYSPAGFFPWLIEFTQVSTGLPFWSVIAITTIGARLFLLPFVIRSTRATSRMAPIQPQMQEIREKVNKAKAENNTLLMQQAMIQQQALFKKAGINPFDQMLMSILQICVQFGFFIALRRMCAAPVEQMKYGGFGYLTDLTVPDPYYITPVINTLVINLQLLTSRKDMMTIGSPASPHIINGIRVLTLLGLPFMCFLPAAINVHLITSISFIVLQTILLRNPAVRTRLGIAQLPKQTKPHVYPSMMDTRDYLKEWFEIRAKEAALKHAEREKKMRSITRR